MKSTFVINMTDVTPRVLANGKPLVGVREVRVVQRHGEYPQVVCVFDATDVQVDGMGDMEVMRESDKPDASTFLASVDASALASAVMEHGDFETNPIVAAVGLLREMAG